MCLTFQMMTLEKYCPQNFELFLGGTPILAPRSAASQTMSTPPLPMSPLFYCRILFFLKNVDVWKKKKYCKAEYVQRRVFFINVQDVKWLHLKAKTLGGLSLLHTHLYVNF